MSTDETILSQKYRLNPFAFPAETNVRFILLMVAAVTLACNLSVFLTILINPDRADIFTPPLDIPNLDTPLAEYLAQTQAELLKLVSAALRSLAVPTLLVLLVLALSTVIYRSHPARLRRRKKLTRLPADKDPKFQQQIAQLAQVANVSSTPTIEMGPGLKSQNAQAFGLRHHYSLRLDGGLRLLMRKAPEVFRAIVLHELAHIVNRDVGRTYFAQALWRATVSLTIIPLVLGVSYFFVNGFIIKPLLNGFETLDWQQLLTRSLPTVILFAIQVAVTLGLVAAIRAGLLRIRETYADWRTALWGAAAGLGQILQPVANQEHPQRFSLWRLHPTARERLAALQHPEALFQIKLDLPFVVGWLLAFVVGGLFILVIPLTLSVGGGLMTLVGSLTGAADAYNSTSLAFVAYGLMLFTVLASLLALVVPLFSLGYLVAGTVGLQVQRQAVADLAAGRQGIGSYIRLLAPAALLALGFELGFSLAPLAVLSPAGVIIGQTGNNLPILLLLIPLLGTTIILIWLCLIYVRFFARRIFGRHLGASPPQLKRFLLTLHCQHLDLANIFARFSRPHNDSV